MATTSMPAAAIERIAVSRPEPGPRTSTSTFLTPCSIAARAHFSAASCAAYGVDLRNPLKPTCPELAQERTLPSGSEIETIVLLNELLMRAAPKETFLRSFLRPLRTVFGLAITSLPSSYRRRCASDPCECERWCGSVDRARADPCGDGSPAGS